MRKPDVKSTNERRLLILGLFMTAILTGGGFTVWMQTDYPEVSKVSANHSSNSVVLEDNYDVDRIYTYESLSHTEKEVLNNITRNENRNMSIENPNSSAFYKESGTVAVAENGTVHIIEISKPSPVPGAAGTTFVGMILLLIIGFVAFNEAPITVASTGIGLVGYGIYIFLTVGGV